MAFVERRARDRGYQALDLYTRQFMTENIAWYGRQGDEQTATLNEKGFARVYMSKLLG